LSVQGEYTAVVLSAYLEGGDVQQWVPSRASILHEVYGLIVQQADSRYKEIEEYTRVEMFEILYDMDADHDVEGQSVAESFCQQIYTSRRVLALI